MYVYIIKQGEFFKIGKTHNLESRRAALQCSTPNKIEIIVFVETDEQCLLEKKLHNELSQYHSSGEWFKFETSVLEELIENYGFEAYEKSKRSKSDIQLINRLSNSILLLESENEKLKFLSLGKKALETEILVFKSKLERSERKASQSFELLTSEKQMTDTALNLLNNLKEHHHEKIILHKKYKKNINLLFFLIGCLPFLFLDSDFRFNPILFLSTTILLSLIGCIFGFRLIKSEMSESINLRS